MEKSTIIKIIFFSIVIIFIIFSNIFKELAILLISVAIISFISKDLIYPEIKKLEDKEKEEKYINNIFRTMHLFIEYLHSNEYYNDSITSDERVKYEISYINQNIQEFRKYFAFNIEGRPNQYDKKITLLKGRYKICFRSHRPYQSKIHKVNRVHELDLSIPEAKQLLDLMYKEIQGYVKREFGLNIRIP